MKTRVKPSIVVFGGGITPDDVLYYTEQGIEDIEGFIGQKVLKKTKRQTLRDAELSKSMKFFEKKIIQHTPHSGVHKGFKFQKMFNTKPLLDTPVTTIEKRIKRIKQKNGGRK